MAAPPHPRLQMGTHTPIGTIEPPVLPRRRVPLLSASSDPPGVSGLRRADGPGAATGIRVSVPLGVENFRLRDAGLYALEVYTDKLGLHYGGSSRSMSDSLSQHLEKHEEGFGNTLVHEVLTAHPTATQKKWVVYGMDEVSQEIWTGLGMRDGIVSYGVFEWLLRSLEGRMVEKLMSHEHSANETWSSSPEDIEKKMA